MIDIQAIRERCEGSEIWLDKLKNYINTSALECLKGSIDYIPALLDLIAEKDKRIAELARVTAERDALREFAIRASRDFTECDKMFLHVGSLKQDSGYNAYMVDARQSGAVPLTFEQWLRGPEQEAR